MLVWRNMMQIGTGKTWFLLLLAYTWSQRDMPSFICPTELLICYRGICILYLRIQSTVMNVQENSPTIICISTKASRRKPIYLIFMISLWKLTLMPWMKQSLIICVSIILKLNYLPVTLPRMIIWANSLIMSIVIMSYHWLRKWS